MIKAYRPNRVLSHLLTRVLMKTPLTPNQITFLSMLCGVAAGIFVSNAGYAAVLTGAFLYELAIVLDNCDGEIARAKSMKSKLGEWLDIVSDFVVDISLFTGLWVGAGMGARHAVPLRIAYILCLSGGFLHVLLVILEKLKGFGPAVYETSNPDALRRQNFVYQIFDALREGEASWFVVLFALAGQAPLLLWFGAVYMQLIWISALVLNFKWLKF